MSVGLAIVLGASYYNLPETAQGGFTRGSILFVALLVNCLDAFGEVSYPAFPLLTRDLLPFPLDASPNARQT